MRVLVFQHIEVEHPGVFREFLAADNIAWDAVELDAREAIPPLEDYDVLWVMGGPMDTWEEADYPWLVTEKQAIREAVEVRRMPFLGVCLGAQLLAEAMGGQVTPMREPEIGVLDVALTPEGRRSPLLAGTEPVFKCLQWHSYEIRSLPPRAHLLARSPACAVQAFVVGQRAFGVQYHVEQTTSTISDWGRVPVYAEDLSAALGEGALARLEAETAAHMPAFKGEARRLYDNFMGVARRPVA